MLKTRFKAAAHFSLKHLTASAVVAALCAVLVFFLWYPYPYNELAGGRALFLLVVTVDAVIGPLLSFVVYNPNKPRRELWRDLGVIFVFQLGALAYGVHSVTQARPVWLAFEGDRFRIVAVPDINHDELGGAEGGLATLSWTGPKLVGVRLISNTDPEFPKSIQRAMQGEHPAFRPERWVDYDTQRSAVVREAKPLAQLKAKQPQQAGVIDAAVAKIGLQTTDLGVLPLHSGDRSDWSVVVNLKDGSPAAYLPVDAWLGR